MELKLGADMHIIFPEIHRQTVLEHCRNALALLYDGGSAEEGKAFGLLFGTVVDTDITVGNCFALQRNVRSQQPFKGYIDKVMEEHAVVSQTPLDKRGWAADPAELFARIKECRSQGQMLLGTYHMHRVGWEHDPVRDTPTRLDAVLAEKSGLLMFIISMVDPEKPIIRAFFEGRKGQEILIR